MKRWTFLFPGQGAQAVGMGKDLYQHSSSAKEIFQNAEDILKRKLLQTMFEGDEASLNLTINSQPALFVHSFALFEVLKKQLPDLKPQLSLGLSLGEYSSFVAAGKTTFEDTLRAVSLRGELMGQACEEKPGTMAVILGLSQKEVEELVQEANLPHDLWAANFNAPGQVVISGTIKGIEKGTELAKAKGAKRVLPLAVQGAFHSGLMKSARDGLKPQIDALKISKGFSEVIMNVSARKGQDEQEIKRNLIAQVTEPVRWQESIEHSMPETDMYLEIGQGKTLSGLNKRIGVQVPTLNLEKLEDLELLAKELI